MKKAIYSGSFDPFTNGHLDIIKQASKLFDEVIVLIACNSKKQRHFTVKDMKNGIQKVLEKENLKNCKIDICTGLVAEYCKEKDIEYSIRGLRNNMDYNYEENIAICNEEINPNLMSIYFRANRAVISSSFVRELFSYNGNIKKYVPNEIIKIMNRKDV